MTTERKNAIKLAALTLICAADDHGQTIPEALLFKKASPLVRPAAGLIELREVMSTAQQENHVMAQSFDDETHFSPTNAGRMWKARKEQDG